MDYKGLRRGESVTRYIQRVGREEARKTPFLLALDSYTDGSRCNWGLLQLLDRLCVAKNVKIDNLESIVKHGLYKSIEGVNKAPKWAIGLIDENANTGFVYCHLASKRVGYNCEPFRNNYGDVLIRFKDYVKGYTMINSTPNVPLNYPRLFASRDDMGEKWDKRAVLYQAAENEFDFLTGFASELHVYTNLGVKDFESVQIHGNDLEGLADETVETLQKNKVDVFYVDGGTIYKLNKRGVWKFYGDV